MGWADDFNDHIKNQGKNTDVRLFIGVITSLTPLSVGANNGTVGAAEWTTAAAKDAAVGDRVVMIQDMTTRTFIVLGRLVNG